jgi:hypothetical protein
MMFEMRYDKLAVRLIDVKGVQFVEPWVNGENLATVWKRLDGSSTAALLSCGPAGRRGSMSPSHRERRFNQFSPTRTD